MRIALYQGKSFFPSRLIEAITWSDYSHAAFVFDRQAQDVATEMIKQGVNFKRMRYISEGSVVEAWSGGVKNAQCVSELHAPGTPVQFLRYAEHLTRAEEQALIELLIPDIGLSYDYLDIARFLFHVNNHDPETSVFCSMLVASRSRKIGRPLLARCADRRVDPGMLLWPTILELDGSTITV